jgi:hypothetical protein
MGIFGKIKHGFEHLKNSSFRDALIKVNKNPATEGLGIKKKGPEQTQLEELEQFHIMLGAGARKLKNVPLIGNYSGQIAAGADAAVNVLDPINKAVREQDESAKAGKGSFDAYKKIGLAGGKGLKKAVQMKELPVEYGGTENHTTDSRYHQDLVV